jgi:hypothetical protein
MHDAEYRYSAGLWKGVGEKYDSLESLVRIGIDRDSRL